MKNKFIFYFPVEEIGGVHTYIYRIVEEANKNGNNECIVIDNDGGTVYKFLDNHSLKYISIENSLDVWKRISRDYNVDEYTLIFGFAGNFYEVLSNVKLYAPNLKIIFSLVHPEAVLNFYAFTLLNKISFNKYKIKKFFINKVFLKFTSSIKDLLYKFNESNSLIFMDEENLTYNEKLFNMKIDNAPILPIPIDNLSEERWNRHDGFSLAWLGRLEKSKSNVLYRILRDYKKYILENRIENSKFVIIGDGDGRNLLEKEVHNLGIESKVEFKGTVLKEDMLYEISKSNILFGMGTSALEGAKIGVPTVLIDWYKYVPKEVNYRWLYETTNFTLGRIVEKGMNIKCEKSFSNIIDEYIADLDIGHKSYKYAKKHQVKNVYNSLCGISEKCKFTMKNVNMDLINEYYRKIFTVRLMKFIKSIKNKKIMS